MPASSSTRGATLAAGLVAALTVLPLVVVAGDAMAAGAGEAADYLFRPRIGELLRNTGMLIAVTVPATLVLGTLSAWLVERTDLPGARVWRWLLLAPLAVPSFVSAYAWVTTAASMTGLAGAAFVTTLSYFPFVFLPAAAMLRTLDGGDEDAARSLGLSPLEAVRRTVLPRLRPALSGGGLLVALHLLAEYGALEMMRFQTFTTAIVQQYAVGFSDVAGNLLASVLLLLCLLVLGAEILARGRRRIARLGSGAAGRAPLAPLGRWSMPASLFLITVVGLALAVPVLTIARWLVTGPGQSSVAGDDLTRVTLTTLGLALVAGLVTVAAALPGAWLLTRQRSALTHLLERTTFVSSALPGVVVGLALVTLSVRWAAPAYQTVGILVLAYTILFCPRAMVSLRAGFDAAPPELSEASRSLGQGSTATLTRVVLPLAAPSVLAGFVLVALAVTTELTATLLLAPTGVDTLALAFWGAASELDYASAAPYAAVMVALSAPLTVVLVRQIVVDR